jgi:DNA-binding transcriptional LysR family regulator
MVHKIETAAGFTIIDRSSKPLGLTAAGREFISEAFQILQIAQERVHSPGDVPGDRPE